MLESLAFTLSQRRSHLRVRSFLITGTDIDDSAPPTAVVGDQLPFAFVFTGQGAQYPGMAKELLQRNPSFLATIRELDGVLQTLPSDIAPKWTLESTIMDFPSTSKVNDVTRSQPLCTAVQIALVEQLRGWGVRPVSVLGHSSGEIAAAYAAGLLTAKQAILVAYFRGYAVGQLRAMGCMMAAGVSVQAAKDLIKEKNLENQVCVACVNAPENVTLSGSVEGIDILMETLQATSKFVRKLETGKRAYHSYMMRDIGSLYEELLATHLDNHNGSGELTAKMYSSVGNGGNDLRVFADYTPLAEQYWRDNLESPVQFSSALARLAADGEFHLVELGPHAALKGPTEQIRNGLKLSKQQLRYTPTLLRGKDSDRSMKILAGTLFLHGYSLNWSAVNGLPKNPSAPRPLYDLPPYPWDYSSGLLWSEPRASVELRNRKYVRHELLGSRQLAGNDIDWSWRNMLRLNEVPWMRDHRLEDQIVFPAAGYLALAMAAVSQIRGFSPSEPQVVYQFRNVSITAAFVVRDEGEEDKDVELHTSVTKSRLSTANASADWYEFCVSSWTAGQAIQHCAGSVRIDMHQNSDDFMVATKSVAVDKDGYETWAMGKWYNKLSNEGLCFGPKFQSLTSLSTDGNRVRTEAISTTRLIQRDNNSSADTHLGTYYAVHPLVIDACLQAAIMGGTAGNLSTLRAHLPVFISKCQIRTPGPECVDHQVEIHTRSTTTGPATKQVDCTLRDATDAPVVNLEKVHLALYNGKTTKESNSDNETTALERHPCLRVSWKPDILRLHADTASQLREYVTSFIKVQDPDLADDESASVIGALIDLAGHKNPRMRVLELGGGCQCKSKQWLGLLDKDTAFPRCRSWSGGELDEDGKLNVENDVGPFDVVVIPGVGVHS